MPAYLIGTMKIHDPETYRKYTALTSATIKKYGGRFLTRGDQVTTLEGDAFTERMVIIEFPSKAIVDEWYNSPEYTEAVKFRHAAAVSRVLVQEARENMENLAANV